VNVLDLALRASLMTFMVSSLAGAGLGVSPRAVMAPLAHARFVLLALAAGWLVCPALAYLVLRLIPLDAPYATGLLLLSLAPCAPFAPPMMRKAGGDPAYVAAFVVLSAVATAVLMPVGVPLLIRGLSASPMAIAGPLLVFVLVPLLLGMTLRGLRPVAADRATPAVAAITSVATIVLVLLMPVIHGRGVLEAIGSHAIVAQVVFVAVVTVITHAIGATLAGPQRSVLTIGMCTRNLGAALAPLAAIDSDPRALVMIAIAIPVTVVMSAMAAGGLARRAAGAGARLRSG
jgi:bile acid:Na+ symporter, BASS family